MSHTISQSDIKLPVVVRHPLAGVVCGEKKKTLIMQTALLSKGFTSTMFIIEQGTTDVGIYCELSEAIENYNKI